MDNGASSYLRFLNGEEKGFVEIVTEYRDGLVLFMSNITGDIHMAEEIADETFLKLYMNKPDFKPKYTFKTWLYTIGRNIATDIVRKQKKMIFSSLDDYYYISDNVDIESDYIKSEDSQRLHKAMKNLKKEYSQVLYLLYFENFAVADAAKNMGKNKKQTSNLVFRAKNALKAELEKEGYE